MFWNKPLPHKLRQQDLEEAQRQLHEYRKQAEFASSTVRMYEARVDRLKKEIAADPAPVPAPRPAWSLWSVPAAVRRQAMEEKSRG